MIQPTILFDLDGTLTDSRAGIVGCLHRAMRTLGHTMDEAEDLTWAIGPPTEVMFARLLANRWQPARSVEFFDGVSDGSF